MFGKKKEIQTPQDDKHIRDYTTWEKDFRVSSFNSF